MRAGWMEREREGGWRGWGSEVERERMVNTRDPICALLQQTHLNIVVSNRTGGGTGGDSDTLTWFMRASVRVHTHI